MERDGACSLRAPFMLFSSMTGFFADLWLRNGLIYFHTTLGPEVSPTLIKLDDSNSEYKLLHF